MGRLSTHQEASLVAQRAADWLQRLETADARERAAFMAWLKESPRHVREMLLAATWDKVLEDFDADKRMDIDALLAQGTQDVARLEPRYVSPLMRKAYPSTRARRLRWVAGFSAAAAVLFAAVTVWGPAGIFGRTYSTAIGEQQAFELNDGSVIHLNAHSRVSVDFSDDARDVYLLDGQAIFKVERDAARPFRVHVDGASIQAVGTQFDVHRQPDRTTVAVIEGRVKIFTEDKKDHSESSAGPRTDLAMLGAGEAASIVAGGKVTRPATVDVAEATAWRQRRLVFRKDTLADMAAEFNRYNRAPQIRVEGEALQQREFNGVFDADDPEALLRFLADSDGVAVDRRGGEVVIHAR